MYLQNAKSKRKPMEEGEGRRSIESSEFGVISANEKADFIRKIKCMYTRPCSLISKSYNQNNVF